MQTSSRDLTDQQRRRGHRNRNDRQDTMMARPANLPKGGVRPGSDEKSLSIGSPAALAASPEPIAPQPDGKFTVP